MQETTITENEVEQSEHVEEQSLLFYWQEAVGKVYKLVSKSYGVRTITYTQIKAVKETGNPGEFDVEVSCAEITARVLNSKRSHSSGCKEGVINQTEESILMPSSFGDECPVEEFEKISSAIMVHTTTSLDLVMQSDPDDTAIEVPIDLPHLKLTEMEASLLRYSPFLIKNIYLLTPNSRSAAFESINQEIRRAARNSRLNDTCDPVYVIQKSEAVTSLRNKLTNAPMVFSQRSSSAPAEVATTVPTAAKKETPATAPARESSRATTATAAAAKGTTAKAAGFSEEKKNNITLALRGKPSPAILAWKKLNPSCEGVVYRIGRDCGLLEFTSWATISGGTVSNEEAATAGKNVAAFFKGPDAAYTGPDREGVYPMFKL